MLKLHLLLGGGTREGRRMLPGVGWLVRGGMDRFVVFGYSRGAALARKFVSTLTLLRKGKCEEVQFIGVFDTVSAMDGIQRPGEDIATDVVFEDGTLHVGVKRAVHIVALDEDRLLFGPTLICKDGSNPERITEVWFPGVHGDIGGGYWHDGLSDGALKLMIDQCERALTGGHVNLPRR